MKTIRNLLRQSEFQVFLCVLSLALFSWPIAVLPNMEHPGRVFLYLYGSWGFIILMLFFVSIALASEEETDSNQDAKDQRHV